MIVDVGPKSVAGVARRLGVLSHLNTQPSLALGTSEVNLLELTGAYAPFANGGFSAMPHGILKIRTRSGRTLYERQGSGQFDAIAPVFASEMTYMMRETVRMGTAKRARLDDRDAAGKTGTGQAFRDAWFIGYTRDLVAGVWVGNDDNVAMKDVTGGSVPAGIWAAFMNAVKDSYEPGPLIALEGNPAMDVAAGAGWYEDPDAPRGVSEDEEAAGGYVELDPDPAGATPLDGEPMDISDADAAAFDKMFEDSFGEEERQARRSDD